MSEKIVFRTDHLRHSSAFCLANGLFRSVPKGKRKDMFLDAEYETTEAIYHFESRHALGVTEMRVMQGLIALAPICGKQGNRMVVGPETTSDMGLAHRQTLELIDNGLKMDALVVETSFYQLAKEIGYSDTSFNSGQQVKILRTALERLWSVTVLVVYKNGSLREGYHILSKYRSTPDNKFTVAINPHIAECVIGTRKYSRIEMSEIRALKTDSARFIHQRLCGWINPGKDGRVQIDTLCGYVWPEQALNIKTIQKRKRTVRGALEELTKLGWTVNEYAKEKFTIIRRGIPD
jgi:hypothetical protein